MRTIMGKMQRNGIVVPAFNVPYLPMMKPLVQALRDTDSFGLLEVARLEWEKFQACSLEAICETYNQCKDERFTRLHLDHIPVIDEDGKRVDFLSIIRRAIELGFDSVMVDGSRLSLADNIEATRSVVELAHAHGIPVEAELGAVIGHENGPMPDYDELYTSGKGFTDIEEARYFVHETNVDWLSISFGNVHGAISQARRHEKKVEARLNIDHLKKIQQAVGIPLVLHGGSGIQQDSIRQACENGIVKINIATELRQSYETGLKESPKAAIDAVYAQAVRILKDGLHIAGKAGIATQCSNTTNNREFRMNKPKTKFALMFGNRGFFPASLQTAAREEMLNALRNLGHDVLVMDAGATKNGAVETRQDGEKFARFLHAHAGEFGGVILCLPNFGDENGAVAALQQAGVPILIHAYPDRLDQMAPEIRRDAFCGKFSIMDVFCQNRIKFTAIKPHTVEPASLKFKEQIDYFDRVCRVVAGIKNMRVASIGARTGAFKTVRIDELALQKYGISMETFDLSDILAQMAVVKETPLLEKAKKLEAISDWSAVPSRAREQLARLGVVLDSVVEEYQLDAIAMRCWLELEQQAGISPCVLLGEMNDRGKIASCEVDVGSAVTMYALKLATGTPSACLDWNNNYGDEDDKCILFHCGPVPMSLMTQRGKIEDHAILANALGKGCSYGCNVGRIRPMAFTFGNILTHDGKIDCYIGQGEFTSDPIPTDFFGCAGVAKIDGLQDVLLHIGRRGHRHHVSVSEGRVAAPLIEALGYYLNFETTPVA